MRKAKKLNIKECMRGKIFTYYEVGKIFYLGRRGMVIGPIYRPIK
jgi:hypothetical protein